MENSSDTAVGRSAGRAGTASSPGTESPAGDDGGPERSGPAFWRAFRGRIAGRPTLELVYRVGVAVVGTVVFVVGVITIPFPGPGWALVFAGIGILATEFAVARRALVWLRDKYRRGMAWYISRGPLMQVLAFLATCAVVVATLWILGTFGLVGGWIGVEWQWLHSPLMS
ncbi:MULTISPECIES: TIGR02611 family protein [Nocardia]|uniref:TIGR02611 family protein n=1 Tax=Nocardia TaxID=1817 RepID=UPI0018951C11|nr:MULTISPECIES: TIGR02611 family protein [Nocardia]MBF6348669.1 TIGR02611 family protein [Nocardia flavorosea]